MCVTWIDNYGVIKTLSLLVYLALYINYDSVLVHCAVYLFVYTMWIKLGRSEKSEGLSECSRNIVELLQTTGESFFLFVYLCSSCGVLMKKSPGL